MGWIRWSSIVFVMSYGLGCPGFLGPAAEAADTGTWKSYTNNRYGFSVQYP